jgi:hypothetical protein
VCQLERVYKMIERDGKVEGTEKGEKAELPLAVA